ncbi:ArsR/SmtB family transcription factor [Amycolatopsis benzoatilytica]|uniref:ArsR/SmtB family transcription factor n=1 Tax=Amycolatopsis benzoatilytica TaxID=346045 RepID=UPI000376F8DA|nr:helix-turn-helix domain-containing protein [Amycolatopsis benzoatilytica]
MAELPPRKRIDDAELLRALAHPLRSALVHHLMAVGAATASECAAAVGSTASNCSWHLRRLAEYGLVEAAEGGDGRERPWRACQVGLVLGGADGDPAVAAAHLAVTGTELHEEQELTQRYLDTMDQLDGGWRDAGGFFSYALNATPAELTALTEAIDALVRPYVAAIRQDAPADARSAFLAMRAFRRIGHDGKPV